MYDVSDPHAALAAAPAVKQAPGGLSAVQNMSAFTQSRRRRPSSAVAVDGEQELLAGHAPYDHCTVKYLQQAGLKPAWISLADLGIHGNSHVMMQEKNNEEIAGVIYGWPAPR